MASEKKNSAERRRRILRHYPLVLILSLVLTSLCWQLRTEWNNLLSQVLFGASALVSFGLAGMMFPFLYWISGSADRGDERK